MVIQMDDELLGYIFRFITQLTDSMHTNITGMHDVFKPSIQGLDYELDDLDEGGNSDQMF